MVQEQKFDVVVVGSCNIDLFAYVPRQPKLSETLHGHRFFQTYSGKGANQCVIAAKLGDRTAMVGMVGQDAHGDQYRARLEEEGVNTSHLLATKDAATGVALITVDDNGDNKIVICRGANNCYTPEDVVTAAPILASARAVVCQLEIPPESTLAALRTVRAAGVRTFFNPSPAKAALPDEFYAATSVLVVNEGEAAMMAGVTVSGRADAERAARVLLAKGVDDVVVTMGGDGIVYLGKGMDKAEYIPSVKVPRVLDTAGAGDPFFGGAGILFGYGGCGGQEDGHG